MLNKEKVTVYKLNTKCHHLILLRETDYIGLNKALKQHAQGKGTGWYFSDDLTINLDNVALIVRSYEEK